MTISCLEITYENTQRFSISRSIGPGKTHFFAWIFLVPGRRKTFRSSRLRCRASSFYLAYRELHEVFDGKGSAGMAHAK